MRKVPAVVVLLSLLFPLSAGAQKVGGGDIHFSPKGAGPVLFSHDKHVQEKGVKCAGCHYQIFAMNKGSYKMEMSQLTKGGLCGKCHNGQKSFDVKDTKNCGRCHK